MTTVTKLWRYGAGWRLAALIFVIGTGALAAFGGKAKADPAYNSIPPSWQTDNKEIYPKPDDAGEVGQPATSGQRRTHALRPWYEPRFALGIGANVPELLPIEGYVLFGKFVALRFFYAAAIPFNIRIEMPQDLVSSKGSIGVANPDFTIRMKAIYGPQYGAEALVFPFGGSFFLSAGASHRTMRLTGEARSSLLICSLIEASKDPPCPDPASRIQTDTKLVLNADATTTAILARGALGWFWHVGRFGYFTFSAGLTRPTHVSQNVSVSASIEAPGSDNDITGALAQVKAEKEKDLDQKALKEMEPVDRKTLPIVGITAGVRF